MTSRPDSVTGNVAVRLLGSPRVEVDGIPASFDTRKALAILAFLLAADDVVSRETLIGLLWAEYDPDRARSAFRRTLSSLRSGIGSHRIVADRSTVRLANLLDVDLHQMRAHVASTNRHGHPPTEVCPDCIEPLERAGEQYRGDFLAGLSIRDSPEYESWMIQQAEMIRREFARVLERLIIAQSKYGDLHRAIEVAGRWLALDSLHEPAHRMLMLLHAWAGDRPRAIASYRDCVRILDRELGVAPLPETTALYQAIVEGTAPAAPLVRPRPPEPVSPASSTALPMVGREEQREKIWSVITAVPPGRVLIISGEAGIGKTRLIEDMANRMQAEGATVLVGRAFRGESDVPYAPLLEALRPALGLVSENGVPEWAALEASRLFPELRPAHIGPYADPGDEGPGSVARFLEALSLVVEAAGTKSRLVLAIDDGQWLDHASGRLLAWMGRRLRHRPMVLVVALRPEDTPSDHPLLAVFDELASEEVLVRVELGPLSLSEVAQLTEAAGRDASQAADLHRRSEGNPLLVVELLSGGEAPAAAEIRRILAWRRADLSPLGRQLLATSAVIGRSFTSDTLRAASGRSEEETIEGVEELVARGLLRELPEGSGFDFSHQLVREAVYEDTSQVRRRLLHRRIGEALGAETGADDSKMLAAAAHHFLAAGMETKAAEFFAQAGSLARSVFAHHEAGEHYRAALAAGHPDRSGLYVALGEVAIRQGRYGEAVDAFETAAANASPDGIAPIEHRIGQVHVRLGNWEQSVAHFESAAESLTEPSVRSRLLSDWAAALAHLQNPSDALPYAEQALHLAEKAGDESAQARALNVSGLLASDSDVARRSLQRSLELAERIDDQTARVAALNNLALVARGSGHIDEALQLTETALSVAAMVGDRHQEAALHNNLADLLHTTGRTEESMQHLKTAVALFAEVGTEPGVLEPGVWQLTEW